MKLSRTKAVALGTVGLLVAGGGAAIAYVTLFSGKELRYATQNQLRASMMTTGIDELKTRGVTLDRSLSCTDMPGWTKLKMRVTCTGATADHKTVEIIGTGEDTKQENYYTVLVGGRPVVQNANCLGADCRKKD
ncbi:hypothetical protein J4573_09575 [Actinomadura barringtoniae]|uniref:DUF4333 domain-containing protein n=1 Tax=Actinomadura barringtoniae TaxID=1427535 RepID=A0A939PDN7_9ACTN|nr:hypothetical protein [Actinomadura barringtoniae]MBO2447334.1 hypothetical protein [Actinomadura barringtoniae]